MLLCILRYCNTIFLGNPYSSLHLTSIYMAPKKHHPLTPPTSISPLAEPHPSGSVKCRDRVDEFQVSVDRVVFQWRISGWLSLLPRCFQQTIRRNGTVVPMVPQIIPIFFRNFRESQSFWDQCSESPKSLDSWAPVLYIFSGQFPIDMWNSHCHRVGDVTRSPSPWRHSQRSFCSSRLRLFHMVVSHDVSFPNTYLYIYILLYTYNHIDIGDVYMICILYIYMYECMDSLPRSRR